MKKNRNAIIYLVIAVAALFFLQGTMSAQEMPEISISADRVPLREILQSINRDYNYSLFISVDDSLLETPVTLKAENLSLDDFLRYVFQQSELDYIVNHEKKTLNVFVKAAVPQTLTGRITDMSDGQPLAGAVVISKSGNHAVSRPDGTFVIQVEKNDVLEISSLGFETVRIEVDSATGFLNVEITRDSILLDDAVVIGYGVQNRRDVTSSVVSVKSSDLQNIPLTSFQGGLVGKMSGVSVMETSGDPNGTLNIKVRGTTSVSAGNQPLYVIDGVPSMVSNFVNLNPNDIASIEVLKDASATSIYGSRGANGVVLITTQLGADEQMNISYNGYFGLQQVQKKIDVLDAYEYAEYVKAGHDGAYLSQCTVPGISADDSNAVRAALDPKKPWWQIPPDLIPYIKGEPNLVNTDWQDAIFRIAPVHDHLLSFSGASGRSKYYVSLGYHQKEGIIINSGIQRYTARLNFETENKSRTVKLGINFTPSYSLNRRVNATGAYGSDGIINNALLTPPNFPVYNDDGTYNMEANGKWRFAYGWDYNHAETYNPVALAREIKDTYERVSMTGRGFVEIQLYDGLKFQSSIGGEYYSNVSEYYRPSILPKYGYRYYKSKSNPVGRYNTANYFNWVWDNQITYKKCFGDHNVDAIVLYSAQRATVNSSSISATDYEGDYIQTIDGAGTITSASSSHTGWSLASAMARLQYNYKGKYLATASVRTDGSSRFGKDNRWGWFPSVSLGWRMSDESFMAGASFVDDMKLRASYGVTGNFNIGDYDRLALLSRYEYILGEDDGELVSGYAPTRFANENLGWETTSMVNAGLDLSMFKGLLGLSAEYYYGVTKDMLLSAPVPHYTGLGSARLNKGSLQNQGVEISLSSAKYWDRVYYSISGNISMNRNKVLSLGPNNAPIIVTGATGKAYYITAVGEPIGNFYLLVQDGIFTTEEELTKYPHFPTTSVGDFRFVDVDGDGILDADKDRAIVGNHNPDFTYGLNFELGFYNFDFSASMYGAYGGEILNNTRRFLVNMEGNQNGTKETLQRFPYGNLNKANRKQTGNNAYTSTFHLESGTFLKISNVSLGYSIPKKLLHHIRCKQLRIYASVNNPFTFSKYSGYNPEVDIRPTDTIRPGEDNGAYPLARTYMCGLNIKF